MSCELKKAKTSGTMKALAQIKALYIHEAKQRKLLHNQLRELQGNIRVFCRVRADPSEAGIMEFPDKEFTPTPVQIRCPCPGFPKDRKLFEFDKIFSQETTQDAIFNETKALIQSCVDGYNVAIITYGQTGAGKTYTLMGTADEPGQYTTQYNSLSLFQMALTQSYVDGYIKSPKIVT